jgi:hypothetical protein
MEDHQLKNIPARCITRKQNREKRDEQLLQDFSEMYHKQRLRIDDCIKSLATRYCLSNKTVERILAGKRSSES